MLRWILIFFVLAVVAGAFGLSGIASSFAWLAQLLAVLFVGMLIVSIVMGGVQSASAGNVP